MFRTFWKRQANHPRVRTGDKRRAVCSLRAGRRLNVESLEERTVPSFVEGGELPTTWAPHAVRTAHFTPSDTVDVVTVNQFANQVSVLLGNGDGTFQDAQFFDAGQGVYTLGVGDLRGSGVDDIVVANYYDDSINVLLNNGDGTFDEPVRYSTGAHGHPIDVAVVDLTGDGTLSIVVANNNPYHSSVAILWGNGDGTFQDPVYYDVGLQPSSITFGDFSGSGYLDIVVANFAAGDVSVLHNNGDGTFDPAISFDAGPNPWFVAAGEFSQKGVLDIIVLNSADGTLTLLRGNGDGTFQDPVSFDTADPYPISLSYGDFRGTGLMDLAVVNEVSNSISVFQNVGDGTFEKTEDYAVGIYPADVAAGDFMNDGAPDLIVANQFTNNVSVLYNDSHFGNNAPSHPSSEPHGDVRHSAAASVRSHRGALGTAHVGNAAAAGRAAAVMQAATGLALSPDLASRVRTASLPESVPPTLNLDVLPMPASFQTMSAAVAAPGSRPFAAAISPPVHRALPTLPSVSNDVVDHFLEKPTWTLRTAL